MFFKILILILFIPLIILITFLTINAIIFPPALDSIKDQIVAVTVGIFSFAYLLFIFIYTVFLFRRAGRVFEKFFLKLNLKPENFRFFGRQYKGFIEGRSVVVEYFPPRAIHRSLLNIYLNTDIRFLDSSGIKIPIIDSKIKSFDVNSEGKKIIQEFATDRGINSCLDSILNNEDKNSIKQIHLFPGKIWFRMVFSNITESYLLVLIKELFSLAGKIEDLRKK